LILDKRGEQYGSSDPHNDYLKIALENGLIGLFFYAALLIALVYRLLATYLAGRGSEIEILALMLFGLTISFIIMGFADNILRNTALMWAFWSLAGALFAVSMSTHKTTAVE
jgi:O-antigen ligase